jgi:hypothetical protein
MLASSLSRGASHSNLDFRNEHVKITSFYTEHGKLKNARFVLNKCPRKRKKSDWLK